MLNFQTIQRFANPFTVSVPHESQFRAFEAARRSAIEPINSIRLDESAFYSKQKN